MRGIYAFISLLTSAPFTHAIADTRFCRTTDPGHCTLSATTPNTNTLYRLYDHACNLLAGPTLAGNNDANNCVYQNVYQSTCIKSSKLEHQVSLVGSSADSSRYITGIIYGQTNDKTEWPKWGETIDGGVIVRGGGFVCGGIKVASWGMWGWNSKRSEEGIDGDEVEKREAEAVTEGEEWDIETEEAVGQLETRALCAGNLKCGAQSKKTKGVEPRDAEAVTEGEEWDMETEEAVGQLQARALCAGNLKCEPFSKKGSGGIGPREADEVTEGEEWNMEKETRAKRAASIKRRALCAGSLNCGPQSKKTKGVEPREAEAVTEGDEWDMELEEKVGAIKARSLCAGNLNCGPVSKKGKGVEPRDAEAVAEGDDWKFEKEELKGATPKVIKAKGRRARRTVDEF